MNFDAQFRSAKNIFNLPNSLTLFRIALVPVIAFLLEIEVKGPSPQHESMWGITPGKVAAFFIILAGITDLLDGYFARKWSIESLLGKFLDPVADKLLLMVGLIELMKLERVDAWLAIVLLSRELLITALRGVAAGEGIIISAGQSGKVKLTFQLTGLGFLMWYGYAFGFQAYKMGLIILYIALFISLFSGCRYLTDFFRALSRKKSLEVDKVIGGSLGD
ncbi:MAG: CDP-diacylglycerol--glycerol-3-phosphate 3-phosphatidyltransferase [Deltaproteobacteria bacterium]|nr:CDP-diacylglycerol--glycerol-3-phosphate 3-phosphatidyltransferase [Deltaproteobacteria bacterium]